MGSFLSLPLPLSVLSLLALPSFSYTTSFNVLFFYMTWATLVLANDPLKVQTICTTTVRLVMYLVPSLLFFVLGILLRVLRPRKKSPASSSSPTSSSDNTATAKAQRQQKRRVKFLVTTQPLGATKQIKVTAWGIFNSGLAIVAQALLEWLSPHVDVSVRLPLPWDIALGVLQAFIGREILGYILHRMLHSSSPSLAIFRLLGQRHRSWYHDLETLGPFTASYDHPAVFLLIRFLPTFLPAALLRLHLLTYLIYVGIISFEETITHSGFRFFAQDCFLVISRIGRRAETHLLTRGKRNFGVWGLLDWVCGTALLPANVHHADGLRRTAAYGGDGDDDGGVGADTDAELDVNANANAGAERGRRGGDDDVVEVDISALDAKSVRRLTERRNAVRRSEAKAAAVPGTVKTKPRTRPRATSPPRERKPVLRRPRKDPAKN